MKLGWSFKGHYWAFCLKLSNRAKTLCRAGKRPVGATLSEGGRDKPSLGHDECPHAQEYTAAVRGVTLAEEQIRAGSTNTAGMGEGELSFLWKWQHLLHPWEKQEKNGDRWAGLSVSCPCCSWASQAPVLSTSHRSVLLGQQFCCGARWDQHRQQSWVTLLHPEHCSCQE